MCGRYTVFTESEIIEIREIIREISRKFGNGAVSTGEIFPTNTAPVLTMENNRLAPSPVSWGFPKWDGKGVNINARNDTVLAALDNPHKRSIWRNPILTRRCVIPSTGFYEWAATLEPESQLSFFGGNPEPKPGKKERKIKLHFHRPNEPVLYMAGMIDTVQDKDGQSKDVFVILTTAANQYMSPFHDRMPVILTADECEKWIQSEAFMREVLAREGSPLEWEVA